MELMRFAAATGAAMAIGALCVRDNVCVTASFGCANRNRTGYGRYENNDVRESLSVGTGRAPRSIPFGAECRTPRAK